MTDERDELAKWAEDFRGAVEPALAPEAILEQAARDARRERLAWVEQVGGLVFAVAAFLAIVVRSRSWLLTGLSAIVVPTLVALFGYFVHLTFARRRAVGRSVRDHAAIAVSRRRSEVRLLAASRGAQAFLAVVFWAWFPLFVHSRAERFAAQPWRLVVAVIVSSAVFAASYVVLTRKLARARDELERWEKALSALDGDADRAP